jgi:hypothetical protein
MARDSRPGPGSTNAGAGPAPTAAPTARACCALARASCVRAFFPGPSFHALRIRRVLSLVVVRVYPILRPATALDRGWCGKGEGKEKERETYVGEDDVHIFCVCGM